MLKIRSNKQGFSLIELLVTISIIGILSAVAIPAYQNYIKKARLGVAESIIQQTLIAIKTEEAVGNTLVAANLWALVKSKDKTHFGTPTLSPNADATEHCIQITAKTSTAGGKYATLGFAGTTVAHFKGCMDTNLNIFKSNQASGSVDATAGVCDAGVCGT